jgi:hypothetical protein
MKTQQAIHVLRGTDRSREDLKIWGVIPLQVKISTDDTNGALFLFEHADMPKGSSRLWLATSRSRCAPVIRCSFPGWSPMSGPASAIPWGRSSWQSSRLVLWKRSSVSAVR